MKILLATFWEVPHVGGVWNYMQQLKSKLEVLGHEVDLLGYGVQNKFVHVVNKGRKVSTNKQLISKELKKRKDNNSVLYEDLIVNYYEEQRIGYTIAVADLDLNQYDLIHTQDVVSTGCISLIKPNKTPLIATLHGCVAHELNRYVKHNSQGETVEIACNYFNDLEHTGALAANCTIVANNWLKEVLIKEFYVPEKQIEVFHYGYDIDTFLERMHTPSAIRPRIGKQVIMYTGRLTDIKGVNYLLSALSELKQIKKGWVCWIVGDGEQKAQLKAQSKALGLGKRVLFLGNRNDVPYLLSLSTIFVLPSLIENQPLSVIEAQIARKPVIVSDAGGLPEMVIHGHTGLISPVGDTEVLCNNIHNLLTNSEYREELGRNAQKWALEHWSQDRAIENLLSIYESVLSKKNL
ncbi:glycosyltransferase family 4 protein [Priestia megaterium]